MAGQHCSREAEETWSFIRAARQARPNYHGTYSEENLTLKFNLVQFVIYNLINDIYFSSIILCGLWFIMVEKGNQGGSLSRLATV